jgi:hypothetical protein
VLPVLPVRSLKETSPHEPHDSGCILSDIAGENNVVAAGATQSRATVEEINMVIELVVGKLQEVILGHDSTPLLEISGEISGWEKTRVQSMAVASENKAKADCALATVWTGVPLIKNSQAPWSCVHHLSIFAPGVPGSMAARTRRPCLVMNQRPAVQ